MIEAEPDDPAVDLTSVDPPEVAPCPPETASQPTLDEEGPAAGMVPPAGPDATNKMTAVLPPSLPGHDATVKLNPAPSAGTLEYVSAEHSGPGDMRETLYRDPGPD